MKILAIGDLHGDVSQARRLAEKASKEKVELVVFSGDLTLGETSTKGLLAPFVERKHKVVLVPGNHESLATADFLASVYGATNLHGYSVMLGDAGLFGCGSANIGIFQLKEKEIYNLLKKGFEKVKDSKKKIMITHVHPDGTLMGKLGFFKGSSAVKKAIEAFQPDIAICSHVHEAEGIEETIGKTRLINVGKNGRIIEI